MGLAIWISAFTAGFGVVLAGVLIHDGLQAVARAIKKSNKAAQTASGGIDSRG